MHRAMYESLEDRKYFAVTALFNAAAGVLNVSGDAANNQIIVSRNAAGHIKVNNGAVPIAGGLPTTANTNLIAITGGDGHDLLKLDETNGVLPNALITGGNGNDNMVGGSGPDQFFGGAGNDSALGNRGDDVALMGAGDDVFTWNPGDGSDTIEGDDGFDTMQFNGAGADEVVTLSNNGGRLKFFRNVATVTMDTNRLERVNFEALGGVDTISVGDLSATHVREVNLDLSGSLTAAQNDSAVDKITVHGKNAVDTIDVSGANGEVRVGGLTAVVKLKSAAPLDELTIKANGGHDTVSASTLATPIKLTLDGGDGDDRLIGSDQAELFIGGNGKDNVLGNRGDDVALLGEGDDTFTWNPGDGSDTIEGGGGAGDLMLFNGADVAENVTMTPNGGRLRFFRDVAAVTMDTNDVEKVLFNAKGGVDNVTIHSLAGTDVKQVKVDLGATPGQSAPDASADKVTVVGTTGNDAIRVSGVSPGQVKVAGLFSEVLVTGAKQQNDQLIVNGIAGHDNIDASSLPNGIIQYRADGGAGNDVMIGSHGADLLFGGDGNDSLNGLSGDDLLNGNAGHDILNGGAGNDILVNGEVNTQ